MLSGDTQENRDSHNTNETHETHLEGIDTVLVVDFGAQYAQLIARRVRECQVYSEIVPATMPAAAMLAMRPAAIILSGGPASVYAPGAPPAPEGLLEAGIPILGICYGFQLMVSGLGGVVERTGGGEYGATELEIGAGPAAGGVLLDGLPARQQVWMSHGDTCAAPPPGFTVTARTGATPVAAAEDQGRRLYGVQFHPEVVHSEHGMQVLRHFLAAAGCRPAWTMRSIVDEQVAAVSEQVGDGRAICGLSGGVDSAVAAALVQRAIGSRLTCVFVDHGLLRKGEAEQVEKDFVAATGVDLVVVDAAGEFVRALAGVTDPEQKRKIIGREFIRAFEQAAIQVKAEAGSAGATVGFLLLAVAAGAIYVQSRKTKVDHNNVNAEWKGDLTAGLDEDGKLGVAGAPIGNGEISGTAPHTPAKKAGTP